MADIKWIKLDVGMPDKIILNLMVNRHFEE